MVRTDLNLPHHSSTKMFLNKSSQNTMYIFTCDFTSLTFRCIKTWFHLFILRFISSVLFLSEFYLKIFYNFVLIGYIYLRYIFFLHYIFVCLFYFLMNDIQMYMLFFILSFARVLIIRTFSILCTIV